MCVLRVKNYEIDEPIVNIIYKLKETFPNQKLRDIQPKADSIVLTCVNSEHKNGQEEHPDAHISLDPKYYAVYHCFACGASTDFVGFIAMYLDSSRKFAEEWLIKNYGKRVGEALDLGESICLSKPITKKLDESILETYQSYCPYLQKRKISREACELLNIKYDPKRRVVVFPVYDEKQNLVMLPTRSIDFKKFELGKDIEKPVYCLNQIVKNNYETVVIVEGLVDSATFWSMGIPAIATMGSISDKQIESINKSCIMHLYLCMDSDAAGKKFTEIMKRRLDKRILTTEIILPAGRKDINELTLEERSELIEKYDLSKYKISK